MFLKDPSESQTWFFAPNDREYVSVSYNRGRVRYSFEIYGRMLQALIEGFDEMEVQIAKKKKFSFNYFKGSTPDDVENAAVGFVQNVTAELEALEEKETIAERRYPIRRFVRDSLVSQVGSGIIDEKNYTDFLPQINVITAEKTNSTIMPLSGSGLGELQNAPENVVPSELANDLYENSGIFPGLIGFLTFPAQCELDRESGKTKKRNRRMDRLLERYPSFRDLYSHFYTFNPVNEIATTLKKEKPEFQKIRFSISWRCGPDELRDLMYRRSLLLRITLLKKGIEFTQENFNFVNDELFVRLSGALKRPRMRIRVTDPIRCLPDKIRVSNPNKFPIDIKVDKFIPEGDDILLREGLAELRLAPRQAKIIRSDVIHFAASETRGYTLTANRAIGNLPGVSNVRTIRTPPQIRRPSTETTVPQLSVLETDTGVSVALSGLPEAGYSAILYRREAGMLEEVPVEPKANGNYTWSDDTMRHAVNYLYTARIFQNDAIGNMIAEVPAEWSPTNETAARLSFKIVNPKSQRKGPMVSHSFMITEATATTSAEQMLQAVNAAGEAGDYSAELESQRTQTSIVTDYMVYQYNKRLGRVRYMGTIQPNKRVNYTVNHRVAKRIRYYVVPKVSDAATLSYLTVTSEIDEGTGQSYSIRYKKWRQAGMERNEILPSTNEIRRNNVAAALLNAPAGLVQTVEMTATTTVGSIRNLRASYDQRSSTNFVFWQFTGTLSEVAYFVVMANYNGVKAPVGLAIPDGRLRRETISFADHRLGGAFGIVRYSIIPVTIKGELYRESRSVKVENMSTFPEEALLRV